MNRNYEVKVSYTTISENGQDKSMTETYIVKSLTVVEACAVITEEFGSFRDFEIESVKKCKIAEIFDNKEVEDRFYSIKVAFITLDEKSGKEKRTRTQMLVRASDTKQAELLTHKNMEGTLADYEIESVVKTQYVDVIEGKNQ